MGVYLKFVVKRAFRVVSGICDTDMIPLSYDRRKNVGVVFFCSQKYWGRPNTTAFWTKAAAYGYRSVYTGSVQCIGIGIDDVLLVQVPVR